MKIESTELYHEFMNDKGTACVTLFKNDGYYSAHNLTCIDDDSFELIKFLKQVMNWWDENIKEEVCSFISDEKLLKVYLKLGFTKSATIITRNYHEKEIS